MEPRPLDGKVALIGGTIDEIAGAIAMELASAGATVAVSCRRGSTQAREIVARVRALGAAGILVTGVVGRSEDARAIVRRVLSRCGRLDILVINADLDGAFYCTGEAIPPMVEQRFGRIVNIVPHHPGWPATNGGVAAFFRAVARCLGGHNITANTISPGFTLTEVLARLPERMRARVRAGIPAGPFRMQDEVAKTVAFLAGEGQCITGCRLGCRAPV